MEKKFNITLKLKSYDSHILDKSVEKIVRILKDSNAIIRGPIPLPTEKEIFTVLRSPHVHKKSREQFKYTVHKRLIEAYLSGKNSIESLIDLDLSSAVSVKIVTS